MAYVCIQNGEVVIGGPLAYRASLNIDKRLNDLVQKLIREDVVNKIASAQNDADKISEYFRAKTSLGKKELSDFTADAVSLLRDFGYVVEKVAGSCEEVMCVILICIMTGIELKGMILNYSDSIECLAGDTDIGCNIWCFFELEGEKLNNFSEEELVCRFFK